MKVKTPKYIALLFAITLFATPLVNAQEATDVLPKYSFFINADFVSRYVWRGQQLGTMSVQPILEFSAGNFTVGSFGSASFAGDTPFQEADLYASYQLHPTIKLTVTDYFLTRDFANNNYFEYRPDSTGHIVEPTLTFDASSLGVPIELLVAANIYGADARKTNGDMNYSTYAELTYKKQIGATDFSTFLGFSITTPGNNLPSFYGNTKPAVVNFGLKAEKTIPITSKFSLPVSAALITNPDAGNIWLVFTASLGN